MGLGTLKSPVITKDCSLFVIRALDTSIFSLKIEKSMFVVLPCLLTLLLLPLPRESSCCVTPSSVKGSVKGKPFSAFFQAFNTEVNMI